jgi:hypothetical protein
MTAPGTLPAADRRRAAALLLACLDGGPTEVTACLMRPTRRLVG